MAVAQRQAYIVERLREHGQVEVATLAEALNVSPMTIHRDLNQLARTGVLRKVRGGAVATVRAATPTDGCAICHRTVNQPRRSILQREGAEQYACCPHCMLMLLAQDASDMQAILVPDFLYGRMLNARTATYLIGSSVRPCCTPSVLAFERRDEAERFQRGFDGTLFRLAEAVAHLRHAMALPALSEQEL